MHRGAMQTHREEAGATRRFRRPVQAWVLNDRYHDREPRSAQERG